MKTLFLACSLALSGLLAAQEGYQVGDVAQDFRLKNVDGTMVSMSDYPDSKGFIVIFTCNHCPYAVAYEDRIISIDRKYRNQGFPVIAINPNDPRIVPQDSFENMIKRAEEKKFPFPYLIDEGQKVFPVYGATRTPHVFVLQRQKEGLVVTYIGTIDDNYADAGAVKTCYLENALDALLDGGIPDPSLTKAIGCSIKVKKD